ncbi:glycosyltransferase family 2 protein [Haladaptatus sp. GCM10025707]|uniref:glycosyltransferase family 2 protein n=1 Tax=unclassified Haladaptatus TaxID=2622732 RepID=UPI0023E7654A|nr:glycosyltransferase family 2 protein [Haladaptatus sp. QDMS2]
MVQKSQPHVTISILNLNGKEMTKDCVKSIISLTNYENFDIVIVDNGSSDGSVPEIKSEFPELEIIENETNEGFSKANNRVMVRSLERQSDYTLLLNNDTQIIQEGWLAKLVEIGESRGDIGIVGCRVLDPEGDVNFDGRYFPIQNLPLIRNYEYNIYQENETKEFDFEFVDEVIGAVFLIKRELIENIGFLDEKYSPAYGEETDYCIRAWDAGYRVAYSPIAFVEHNPNQTSMKLGEEYIRYIKIRNNIRLILTSYPISWIVMCTPYILSSLSEFFLYRDYEKIKLRHPIVSKAKFKYVIKIFVDIYLERGDILTKRRERRDVRELLK